MDSRIPKPTISTSLTEGLQDSFNDVQVTAILNAIERTDFDGIYKKIAMIEDLVRDYGGFVKIPASKGPEFYKVDMDLSQHFPGWKNFEINKRQEIINILNNENKTFSIRANPNNDKHYIIDVNPFTRIKDNSEKSTGNVFAGGLARTLSLSFLIPRIAPSNAWEITDAVLQKKSRPNSDAVPTKWDKQEMDALLNTGSLLFHTIKTTPEKHLTFHTFKSLSYGIKLSDPRISSFSNTLLTDEQKVQFLTKFLLSFLNEHIFLHMHQTYHDDFMERNVLLRKSGLVSLIDYAGVDKDRERSSPTDHILFTTYDYFDQTIRKLKLSNDPIGKAFTNFYINNLIECSTLDKAKTMFLDNIKTNFNPALHSHIDKAIAVAETEFTNKIARANKKETFTNKPEQKGPHKP